MTNNECTKCIHKCVCKTAESCDGYVSGCKHFKSLYTKNGKHYIVTEDSLPEIIQTLLEKSGLSQRQASIKAGINQGALSGYINGLHSPSVSFLCYLLEVFDCDLVIFSRNEMENQKQEDKTKYSDKCGGCHYGKAEPDIYGKDRYIRCTNPEHLAKYCSKIDRSLRSRTNPCCKQYKPKEGAENGK